MSYTYSYIHIDRRPPKNYTHCGDQLFDPQRVFKQTSYHKYYVAAYCRTSRLAPECPKKGTIRTRKCVIFHEGPTYRYECSCHHMIPCSVKPVDSLTTDLNSHQCLDCVRM